MLKSGKNMMHSFFPNYGGLRTFWIILVYCDYSITNGIQVGPSNLSDNSIEISKI